MQRRRSRDPNVADRLVVELDDDDHHNSIPPRPSSPSPNSKSDQLPPPAYSTLPPPYSVAPAEKKEKPPILVQKPPVASSSSKRSRVSTSELRVLVYLYRTVVYGLESRSRNEPEQPTPDLKLKPAKKPLGPRSSSRSPSLIPPPEEKLQFERALAAASAKSKRRSQTSSGGGGGFAQFPLVEDDLDSDYIAPRTPFHSPSQSPPSSPPPFLRPASSLDAPKLKKEKTKAEINAELHVQDALLALRLKEFLRAQGVCEDDLTVDLDDEGKMVEKAVQVEPVKEEEQEEANILDEYFMGIEEEEPVKKDRGPVVEDDDDAPFVEVDDVVVSPPPKLQITTPQRMCSPPPASPSPRPHAVLPTSYMVALLMMRNRHPSKAVSAGEKKGKRKSGLSVVVEVD